jgi:quinoprotein glucose dehydrogenase
MEPSGAGMTMTDARHFNWGVTATDVTYSWDGRVLVSDFITGWKTHEDGRVYELSADSPYLGDKAKEAAALIAEGFDERSVDQLGGLLSHPDVRVRVRVQLALTRKDGGLEMLAQVAGKSEGLARLHGIWGMGVIARRGQAASPAVRPDDKAEPSSMALREAAWSRLLPLLQSEDVEVRAQTIKVLGESGIDGGRIGFEDLLNDESPRVRMFAAIAAGRTRAHSSLPLVWLMLIRNADKDPYLRHAGVYAIEKLATDEQFKKLSSHPNPSLRLATVVALGRMKSGLVARFLEDSEPRVAMEAMRAIHDQRIESVRPQLAALLDGASHDAWPEMIWIRALYSAYRLGDATQVGRVLKVALDDRVSERVRLEALRLLTEWNEPHPVDQSIGLYDPLPKRDPAVAKAALDQKVGDLMKIRPELLEAAIPVILVHKLDTSSMDAADLEQGIRDASLPGPARAKLLELYADHGADGMEGFLVELSGLDNDYLAIEAMRLLVDARSSKAVDAIKKAIASDSPRRKQVGWTLVKSIKSPLVAGLIGSGLDGLAKNQGRGPAAIELLAAAKASSEPAVRKALEAYEQSLAASGDPLAAYYPSLDGGDPAAGKKLFNSHPGGQCMRCHVAEGSPQEGMAGPSLAGVAKRGDRMFLLESLVNPGARVAAGFGVVSLELKDGSTVGGILARETGKEVVIDIAGTERTIPRDQIESMSDAFSAMPPMGALLNPEELRDLVAWLSTLKR